MVPRSEVHLMRKLSTFLIEGLSDILYNVFSWAIALYSFAVSTELSDDVPSVVSDAG